MQERISKGNIARLIAISGLAAACSRPLEGVFPHKDEISVSVAQPKEIIDAPKSPSFTHKEKPLAEISIILTGDVLLGRTVRTMGTDKFGADYPFEKVASVLNRANLVFINLEDPIVPNCPKTYGGMIFCADPYEVEGLKFAGVDVATIANNHINDYGEKGKKETAQILEENGISPTGEDNLVIKEEAGLKFGFLGFDFYDNLPKSSDYQLVTDSKKKVNVLIIGVHWGNEYHARANEQQREWARKLIKAGADVIAGSHPHWVQDSEFIDGKPVYYSLGNFVFDNMDSEQTREGLAVRLTFTNGVLTKEENLPTYMDSWAQPEFVR